MLDSHDNPTAQRRRWVWLQIAAVATVLCIAAALVWWAGDRVASTRHAETPTDDDARESTRDGSEVEVANEVAAVEPGPPPAARIAATVEGVPIPEAQIDAGVRRWYDARVRLGHRPSASETEVQRARVVRAQVARVLLAQWVGAAPDAADLRERCVDALQESGAFAKPTEAEVRAFYARHMELFAAPSRHRVRVWAAPESWPETKASERLGHMLFGDDGERVPELGAGAGDGEAARGAVRGQSSASGKLDVAGSASGLELADDGSTFRMPNEHRGCLRDLVARQTRGVVSGEQCGDGRARAFQVVEERPAGPRPLDEVRTAVVAAIERERVAAALREREASLLAGADVVVHDDRWGRRLQRRLAH